MNIQAVLFDMGGTIETYRYTPELRLKVWAERREVSHDLDRDGRGVHHVRSQPDFTHASFSEALVDGIGT